VVEEGIRDVMNDLEARLGKLESRFRAYRVLTIVNSLVVLGFLWLLIYAWVKAPVQVRPWDLVGKRLTLLDAEGSPRASLATTDSGWAIELLDGGMIESTPTESKGLTFKGLGRVDFAVSEGKPVLTMTDARGEQVWRTP
jgi:hypothetical protein